MFPAADSPLLTVQGLKMHFPIGSGLLKQRVMTMLKAVDGISFSIHKGETLGLVGESGCGKTTVGRCILRVYRPTAGRIMFDGNEIARVPETKLQPLRQRIQLIFQDPFSSLDPRQSVGSIVGEPLRIHQHLDKSRYRERVAELFSLVGLDYSMASRFPHEFSGGQRQRIGIARALATNPIFLVCDEPVSALDVSIQAQITNLLAELKEKLNLSYLFISHDLSVVRQISDRVAVMYLGRLVEITDWRALYENPLHPYTKALLAAVPIPDPRIERQRKHVVLKGELPSPLDPPTGCNFHPRCPLAEAKCQRGQPPLRDMGGVHKVACFKA